MSNLPVITATQERPIGLMADQESGGEMMAKARKKPEGKLKRDEDREERISMEIVVDCYNEGEAAMGWWSYLEDKLQVPFPARCTEERATSPLRVGDEVEVVGMGPEHECEREMFVEIPWEGKRTLAVPLAQLEVIRADEETRQAVEDWHYWVRMGHQL
jgi:hypothetical protein